MGEEEEGREWKYMGKEELGMGKEKDGVRGRVYGEGLWKEGGGKKGEGKWG